MCNGWRIYSGEDIAQIFIFHGRMIIKQVLWKVYNRDMEDMEPSRSEDRIWRLETALPSKIGSTNIADIHV